MKHQKGKWSVNSRRTALAFVLTLGCLLVGCSSTAPPLTVIPTAEALKPVGLQVYWDLQVRLEPDDKVTKLILAEDLLLLLTRDNRLIAVDGVRGVVRWSIRLTSSGYPLLLPTRHGKDLFVIADTVLKILDAKNGKVRAEKFLDFPAGTSPVSDGNTIFIGGRNRIFHVLDAADRLEMWRSLADGAFVGRAGFNQKVVVFASQGGDVYCMPKKKRELLWSYKTADAVTADVVVTETTALVAGVDTSLYCFDLEEGRIRWQYRAATSLFQSPWLVGELILLEAGERGLVGLDAESGKPRWSIPKAKAPLGRHGGDLYIEADKGRILRVSQSDGKITGEITTPFSLKVPHAATNAVFLGTPSGKIVCMRPITVERLRPKDLSESSAR